jgi:hypothetical protein
MKFRTALLREVNETHLVGYLDHISHDQLIDCFGQPRPATDKSQAEWDLVFDDGTIVTIYDYKQKTPAERLTFWHIGGKDSSALDRLEELFPGHIQSY